MQGTLTRHADTTLGDTVQASGLTEREVLAGLTRLTTVDETGRRTRQRIRNQGPLRWAAVEAGKWGLRSSGTPIVL
jgi:hypothetical protein